MAYSVQDFASAIREKYPGSYDTYDDKDLAEAIIEKHPEYKDQVTFDSPTIASRIKSFLSRETPAVSVIPQAEALNAYGPKATGRTDNSEAEAASRLKLDDAAIAKFLNPSNPDKVTQQDIEEQRIADRKLAPQAEKPMVTAIPASADLLAAIQAPAPVVPVAAPDASVAVPPTPESAPPADVPLEAPPGAASSTAVVTAPPNGVLQAPVLQYDPGLMEMLGNTGKQFAHGASAGLVGHTNEGEQGLAGPFAEMAGNLVGAGVSEAVAPLIGPALFGAISDVKSQMDNGDLNLKDVSAVRAAVNGAFTAAMFKVPLVLGRDALEKAVTGAGLGTGFSVANVMADQLVKDGKIDFNAPEWRDQYAQAIKYGIPIGLAAAAGSHGKVPELVGKAHEEAQPKVAPEAPIEATAPPEPVAPVEAPAPAEPPAAPIPAAPEPVAPSRNLTAPLPRELAGAKSRYNIGQDSYVPQFESDVDKALYITSQKSKSRADQKYRDYLTDAVGMTDAEIDDLGPKLRAQIKSLAKASEPGDLHIPAFASTELSRISNTGKLESAHQNSDLPVPQVRESQDLGNAKTVIDLPEPAVVPPETPVEGAQEPPVTKNARRKAAPTVDATTPSESVAPKKQKMYSEMAPEDLQKISQEKALSLAKLELEQRKAALNDPNLMGNLHIADAAHEEAGTTGSEKNVEKADEHVSGVMAKISWLEREINEREHTIKSMSEEDKKAEARYIRDVNTAPTPPQPLITPEAEDLIRRADAGEAPPMSKQLKIVAHDNGIEVTAETKPADVVAELRRIATPEEAAPEAPAVVESKPTPKPPVDLPFGETPEGVVKAPEPDERPTGARKSLTSQDRADYGLNELPSPERKTWREALDKAKSENLDAEADRLAQEVIQHPRALNDKETAGMVIRLKQLKDQYNAAHDRLKTIEDPVLINEQSRAIDHLRGQIDKVTEALQSSGTEKGRNLASQNLAIDKNFDLASVEVRAKAAKKSPLTPEEREALKTTTEKLAAAEKKIVELQSRSREVEAREAVVSQRRTKKAKPQEVHVRTAELASRARRLLRAGCHLS